MIGASIETTCELWASSLREVKKRIRPLFAQERAALDAGLFVSRRRRLRQEAPEEGSLVPSDVPDGLTNINGSEIAAQFENSDDHRHL